MAALRERLATRLWYSDSLWYLPLLPLAVLFAGVARLRRALFRLGIFESVSLPVPVVVVGNVTVGGTGKTPVTAWLAQRLQAQGYRPGIVSRGYGGRGGEAPVQVDAASDPAAVGDEPVLLAAHSGCPVVVHEDRIEAARKLLAMQVDVIIADDGLQHYRLRRDYEIAVVDAARGCGNGHRLPAGPLREPPARLAEVDCMLLHQASRLSSALPRGLPPPTASFHLAARQMRRLDGGEAVDIDTLRGRTVHAVAGIGNPERFFRMLETLGVTVLRHPFPDHAPLTARDIAYDDDLAIVMTEKDAVKCRAFATARHWYVPVAVDMHETAWLEALYACLAHAAGSSGS